MPASERRGAGGRSPGSRRRPTPARRETRASTDRSPNHQPSHRAQAAGRQRRHTHPTPTPAEWNNDGRPKAGPRQPDTHPAPRNRGPQRHSPAACRRTERREPRGARAEPGEPRAGAGKERSERPRSRRAAASRARSGWAECWADPDQHPPGVYVSLCPAGGPALPCLGAGFTLLRRSYAPPISRSTPRPHARFPLSQSLRTANRFRFAWHFSSQHLVGEFGRLLWALGFSFFFRPSFFALVFQIRSHNLVGDFANIPGVFGFSFA